MDKIINRKPPSVSFDRVSWWLSRWLLTRLSWAETLRMTLTVYDAFGTPGDTISAATVCRQIRDRHPRLKINVITPNPELLEYDPNIDLLNAYPTVLRLTFWYLSMVYAKASTGNILDETAETLGREFLRYRAKVYLTTEEIAWADSQVAHLPRPRISVNVMSREMVKVWPQHHWCSLFPLLPESASLIQLGDHREPRIKGSVSYAGKLTMRQSMAILSRMDVHIGPDSFLMHAANGLDVRSVVIFGGSRPAACLGYAENENLETKIECGPCWIATSHGQSCPHGVKCMEVITPQSVAAAVERILAKTTQSQLSSPDRKLPSFAEGAG